MEPLEFVLQLGTTLRLFCRCSKPQLDPFISTLPPSRFSLFLLHHPAFSSSSSSIHFSPSHFPSTTQPHFFLYHSSFSLFLYPSIPFHFSSYSSSSSYPPLLFVLFPSIYSSPSPSSSSSSSSHSSNQVMDGFRNAELGFSIRRNSMNNHRPASSFFL